jgi:outer membrane receptor protein involved in Fe transport
VVRASPVLPGGATEDRAASSSVLLPVDNPRVGADLATLLAEVPGVNVTRRGGFGSFSELSLRGGNPDEVRLYIDGVPINQAVGGSVDLSTLPLGDVERIEVYRGVTPIAFGESALGGVVSISTRAPERDSLTVRAGLGSFGTRLGDLTAAAVLGRLTLYGGGHVISARGDFPVQSALSPTGIRENNDLTQLDGTFRATLALPGRRSLRLGVLAFARDQGVTAAEVFRATGARAQSARGIVDLGYTSRDDLGENSRLRVLVFASVVRDRFADPLYKIVSFPTATQDLTRSVGTATTFEKSVGRYLRVGGNVEGRGET